MAPLSTAVFYLICCHTRHFDQLPCHTSMFTLIRLDHTSDCANFSLSVITFSVSTFFTRAITNFHSITEQSVPVCAIMLLISISSSFFSLSSSDLILLIYYWINNLNFSYFHSGFSVTSAEETRIFKPVSMQTMWWVKVLTHMFMLKH